MAGLPVVPYLQAMQKFAVTQPGTKEALSWELYDYQAYPAAGITGSQLFFQVPAGSSSKTYADTNMELAGQLSAGEDFLVQAIELDFQGGSAVSYYAGLYAAQNLLDCEAVGYSGWVEFWIQSKRFLLDGPFHRFPCTTGLSLFAAVASNGPTEVLIDYAKFGGQRYVLGSPQMINENAKFKVALNSGAATNSGIAGTIGVRLVGTLYRPVQ